MLGDELGGRLGLRLLAIKVVPRMLRHAVRHPVESVALALWAFGWRS